MTLDRDTAVPCHVALTMPRVTQKI